MDSANKTLANRTPRPLSYGSTWARAEHAEREGGDGAADPEGHAAAPWLEHRLRRGRRFVEEDRRRGSAAAPAQERREARRVPRAESSGPADTMMRGTYDNSVF